MLRLLRLLLEIDDLARYVGYFLMSAFIVIVGIMLLMRGEDWNYWSLGLVLIGLGAWGFMHSRRRIFQIIEESRHTDGEDQGNW